MAIFRGTGGAGDSTTDATVTEVTQQAVNAANSATAAASSATSAANSASSASTSATNAATSESNASTSETNASNSATTATNAATAASNAQTAAETAETNAETAQTAAEAAQTSAETAQTAAETAETNAETAQTAAETARDSAVAAYDDFDDRYLGAKSSEPTLDNDGDALIDGALYFDTTNAQLKVYDLSSTSWVAGTLSASELADVETVADNISDVETVVTNIVDIQNASTNAATATTKAAEASASATAAATSATNAETSETNAATSATNAATSETNASTSASAASTSATNASNSATAAATSETNASNSASAASTSATNAATSASNASTSETNAATSATNAANSATSAGNAQTAAETAQSAAETAQAAAEAAQEAIDGLYLGAQTSDPTVDNNGDPVTAGDWYYNTSTDITRIYDGSVWQNGAVSTSGLLASANNLSDVANAATSRTNLGLATVASTGAYSDLSGTPSIPVSGVDFDPVGTDNSTDVTLAGVYDYITIAGQVLTLNQVNAATDISGLATVATSGAYSDLSGTPTLATVATSGAYSDLSGTPSLATVATTGAYSDLTGAPTAVSAFTNDAGYTTNTGDITGVTAGTNLTGGGSSGTVTLNVTGSPSFTDVYVADQIIHSGDTDTYLQFHNADQFRVVTAGGERLEVNNTDVRFAANIQMDSHYLDMNNNDIYGVDQIFHEGDTNTYMQFHAADQWRVVTGGAERLEVNNSAVTIPGVLNVRNAIDLADNDILRFGSGDDCEFFCNGSHMYMDLNGGIGNFYIRDGTTTRYTFNDNGSFTATGNVTAYSDARLKDEIEVIGDALAKVNQLRGVTYVRTDEEELGRQTGVIAQEVEAVLPEAVLTADDEMGTKSVAYGNMVGLLIEAVKELTAKVEELEAK